MRAGGQAATFARSADRPRAPVRGCARTLAESGDSPRPHPALPITADLPVTLRHRIDAPGPHWRLGSRACVGSEAVRLIATVSSNRVSAT